jgi:hypothetical protein
MATKMRLTRKQERWGSPRWEGRSRNVEFRIAQQDEGDWYVLCRHVKSDKWHNTLWENVSFPTMELAIEWCDKFDVQRLAV